MPGSYHIIHFNTTYSLVRVKCYEFGRHHRHQTHIEERYPSVCGLTLDRGADRSCNIGIAYPDWNYDWCHVCVKAFIWTDEARKKWAARGIETLSLEEWSEWIHTPDGKYARPAMVSPNGGHSPFKRAGRHTLNPTARLRRRNIYACA